MRPRVLVSALMVLALLAASGVQAENTGGAASDGLKPGDTLDQSSADRAKDLLPREILSHYQKNEYVNPILDWPPDVYNWPEDFAAGSRGNEGRCATGRRGETRNSTPGNRVPHTTASPSPRIAPADPAA